MLVAQAECLDARVIARMQLAISHEAKAEARTECITEQSLITLCATQLLQLLVNLGQSTRQRLAVSVEVGVVVDIYGDTKLLLKEWAQRHTIAERWEVRQVESAHDAVSVVGRTRESEADSNGLMVKFRHNLLKTINQCGHTFIQIVGIRWQGDRIYNKLIGSDSSEYKICSASVERDDCSLIVSVHCNAVFVEYLSKIVILCEFSSQNTYICS